jgi:hypothetical protein
MDSQKNVGTDVLSADFASVPLAVFVLAMERGAGYWRIRTIGGVRHLL